MEVNCSYRYIVDCQPCMAKDASGSIVVIAWLTGVPASCQVLPVAVAVAVVNNGHHLYGCRCDVLKRLPKQPNNRISELMPHHCVPLFSADS